MERQTNHKNPSWNDVLYKASKSPGQEFKRLTSNGKKKDSPIGVGMTLNR